MSAIGIQKMPFHMFFVCCMFVRIISLCVSICALHSLELYCTAHSPLLFIHKRTMCMLTQFGIANHALRHC